MAEQKPDGIMLVAIYQIMKASLAFVGFLGALIAVLLLLVPSLLERIRAEGEIFSTTHIFIVSVLIAVGFVLMIMAFCYGITAYGLFRSRNWARILSIVWAVLDLPIFPIGTAIGTIIIVYMMNPDVKKNFMQ